MPVVAEVTLTVTVHDACPAFRFPVAATNVPPFAAVTTPAGHVVAAADGVARTSPDGRVSVNDQPSFAARSEVLVIVYVSVEVPPSTTLVGENDLSSWGVASSTLMSSNA